MKKPLLSLCVVVTLLFFAACDNDHKVAVCHKGKIINVDVHAVKAHKAHGDAIDMDGDGYFAGDNACTAPDCNDDNPTVNPGKAAPDNCAPALCAITNLQVLNATCTDPNPTYDLQLRVTYNDAPAAGTLNITIDGQLFTFPIGTSPQTVNVFGLPPTGVDVNVTAGFSEEPTCELVSNALYEAPDCGL